MTDNKTVWLTKTSTQGQKLSLSLPDGTRVLLNNGSTLRYPKAFANRYRETELYGEAFFQVKNDETKPFKIRTAGVVSTALWATFNIQAFPNKNTAITVTSGLIQVKSILARNQGRSDSSSLLSYTFTTTLVLSSGQQAQFDALGAFLIRREVYSEKYLGWTDGEIEPYTEKEDQGHGDVNRHSQEGLNSISSSKKPGSEEKIEA